MSIAWEKIPILAGLTEEALDFLAARAKTATAVPGEILVREGEAGNRMFILRSGEVRVWKSGAKARVEIARLRAGNFFGEMCILETLPRAATVEAAEETELCSLSSIAFYELYQKMPDQYSIVVLNIARDLSRRLRRLDDVFAVRG